ncbi:MAG: sigma-70 family RNA polymerase sigma factor [Bacteroidaceae bacterium]|nr:sigma-70 family RNA polymerase sigma factor [Bacteroidaceae bacterium]
MTGQSKPPKNHQGCRRSRDEAEELFLSNMRLVPYVANQMAIQVTDDTIQDGYIGLWKAALKFDESLGFQFATFAAPVIRNAIVMAWRDRTRTPDAEISLDQPYLHDADGDTEVLYSDTLADPQGERAKEELLLDMYLTARLTEQEKTIALMRMNGKPKTGIGKAFGHSDAWANDRIKSIQRKLRKDFNVKG